ncbi:MAG: hypothetical protein PHO01_12620 [Desulfotomaculaceae bacterium]|nr:hypothetical protein [Desulfotomaculaceae bacterium]
MKKEPRTVSIYLRPELEAELEARGSNRNHIIHRDLERLYTLYRLALREVKLTLPECWFIADMLNGSLVDAYSAGTLWASAEDACALDGLDKKWQVDGKALVKKLKALSPVQALALVDAAERFWQANTGSMKDEDIKKFFGVAIAGD